ncbi:ABC transporter ATP-binding protein [Rhodococcus wratislaviensis]|uniref:Putative ABC transporter ATP-binding protein n=1 Tax=Rhodococcus wratislaviensis NBRC 100605 TaxID=1219028 RepID=X0R9E7_RHOWR|nr:ABC transporter ATP-binding protein [Rhodococcus wratislaviensis]GAF47615.1 putative ABC transporter ATP-binding protein [Rhodococcus wratislaviensis NBRC 100605]
MVTDSEVKQSVSTAAGEGSGTDGLAVRIRGLNHWFIPPTNVAPKLIIDGVDLDIPQKQFVAIIGSSGCGKTTLLNLVAGIDSPRMGTVESLSPEGKRLKQSDGGLGYMFARDALLPWRNLVKNVEYGLEVRGVPKPQRQAAAKRSIEIVGLTGSEHKYPAELSQGMRQRASLARILTADPSFLLMDEPFSALDAETKMDMQSEFSRIWELRPRTVLFVTHDITEAPLLADRVLIMSQGKIVRDIKVPFERPRIVDELRFDQAYVDFVHSLRDEFSNWSSLGRRAG